MGADPWWIWLLVVALTAPWLAGVLVISMWGTRDSGEEPPSLAETAQRRLWTP
jgi:hypothetical protein